MLSVTTETPLITTVAPASACPRSVTEKLTRCAMTGAGYVGEGSPDRADALVWAMSELNYTGYRYTLDNLV